MNIEKHPFYRLFKIYLRTGFYFKKKRRSILILKVDGIGDFILIRNYFEYLSSLNYNIFLVCNQVCEPLVKRYDSEYISKTYTINRNQFHSNLLYRIRILWHLSLYRFDYLLNPNFSREFLYDNCIVRFARAKEKIGFEGNTVNILPQLKEISDQYYTKLITTNQDIKFEFERNNDFFSEFANSVVNVSLSLPKSNKKQNQIGIFLGANAEFRKWSASNFSELIELTLKKFDLEILLLGSTNEVYIANEISQKHPGNVTNLVGATSLTELVDLIAEVKVLVTHDSAALHIGAALGVKVICISNGNHYRRFIPYPDHMKKEIQTVFPPGLDTSKPNLYQYRSDLDINTVAPVVVFHKLKDYISG